MPLLPSPFPLHPYSAPNPSCREISKHKSPDNPPRHSSDRTHHSAYRHTSSPSDTAAPQSRHKPAAAPPSFLQPQSVHRATRTRRCRQSAPPACGSQSSRGSSTHVCLVCEIISIGQKFPSDFPLMCASRRGCARNLGGWWFWEELTPSDTESLRSHRTSSHRASRTNPDSRQ